MSYLGIKEGDVKGLYSFNSISVRDEIAQKVSNPVFYFDREKEKALKDFNITESEIKDAKILIDMFRNMDEEAYLAIEGTPYDGVYLFKRKHVIWLVVAVALSELIISGLVKSYFLMGYYGGTYWVWAGPKLINAVIMAIIEIPVLKLLLKILELCM